MSSFRTGLILSRRPTQLFSATPRRLYSPLASPTAIQTAGGLLRITPTCRQRTQLWPSQIYRSHSNAVRAISFARFLPKLVVKFARVPALFGGATIAGLAYVQYQAQREPPSMPPISFYVFVHTLTHNRIWKLYPWNIPIGRTSCGKCIQWG